MTSKTIIHMKLPSLKSSRNGFTLIELITVITIIALLFALVVGGMTFADRYSKRARTEVVMKATRSALERYSDEWGGYPTPRNPGVTVSVGKLVFNAGAAACLYQAMSADGFDQIMGAKGKGVPSSDGDLDIFEAKSVVLKDMPKEMWLKNGQLYHLIDGFGHPIQYTKAVPLVTATGTPQEAVTINNTYDIWSYGEDIKNTAATSIQSLKSPVQLDSQKWLKNW